MKKLNILYEDKKLLIIDKPPKLLTIGTEKNKMHNLYYEASAYVKKQYPRNKIFIVNRLDKETSGIVVFAKNEELKQSLQNHWEEVAKVREYVAIVEGYFTEKKGTIKNYLVEDKTLYVHETSDKKKGRLAITQFEVLEEKNNYSLIKVRITTGRKHQIRVHLANLGHPIIGDKKYGSTKNPISRLGLHATYLTLEIPYLKRTLQIKSKLPKEFKKIFEESCEKYEKIND